MHSHPRSPQRPSIRSSRWVSRLCLGVALSSCTLTQDEFEPAIAQADAAQPEPGPADDPVPAEATGCTASLQCPEGFECMGDVCVPSECDAGEDVAACVVDVSAGDGAASSSDTADGDAGAATCADGEQSDGETGVDCGGPCPPCAEPGCTEDAECAPGACVAGTCADPSCDDGLLNQDETGPDCGGATCARCAVGAGCSTDSDCEGELFCSPTATCAPVSCQDGAQNGAELGVDCGGGECPGCDVGAPCSSAGDCASSSCVEDTCAEPTCTDAARNGDETDVDCGGSCTACDAGLACLEPSDCASSVCADTGCAAGVAACCQAPSCDDGVRNGGEVATDCGAAPCEPCDVGAPCTQGAQCASNVCAAGSCAELCDDGVLNGDESSADCGGSEVGCPRCADGEDCRADADCASGSCDAGTCVSCSDGLENGDEGGVDCGGSEAGCPACPRCSVENSTDLGGTGNITTITGDACARITLFPGFAPTQLDSYELGRFPVPFELRQECTEVSAAGVFDAQFDRVPLVGLGVDCPVIIDFGGTSAPLQVRWF